MDFYLAGWSAGCPACVAEEWIATIHKIRFRLVNKRFDSLLNEVIASLGQRPSPFSSRFQQELWWQREDVIIHSLSRYVSAASYELNVLILPCWEISRHEDGQFLRLVGIECDGFALCFPLQLQGTGRSNVG